MRRLLFFGILLFVQNSSNAEESGGIGTQVCQHLVDDLNGEYTRLSNQYNVGTASKTDLESVQIALLKARLSCKSISIQSYCADIRPVTTDYRKVIEDEYALGKATIADLLRAIDEFWHIEEQCQ